MNRILSNLKENWITYGFETLVVIVGILIAFGLNNWNQTRLNRQLERDYLERLKIDLIYDKSYYQRRSSESQKRVENYKLAIDKLYNIQETVQDAGEIMLLADWDTEHLSVQDFTFKELNSSGNLGLIQNVSLRDSLISYYKEVDAVAKHVQEINEWSVERLNNYSFRYQIGASRFEQRREYLIENPEQLLKDFNDPGSKSFIAYEQAISAYQLKNETFFFYFSEMEDRTERLIQKLNDQLK